MSAFDLITIHNSALALIDHQPATSLDAFSMDKTLLVNNTVAVAKLARAYGIPTVLTTITAATVGNIYPGVQAQFSDQPPIDRTDTNAWADDRFREAMVATGRRKLVMAGLWTEVCLGLHRPLGPGRRVRGIFYRRCLGRRIGGGPPHGRPADDHVRGATGELGEPDVGMEPQRSTPSGPGP
jgi:hypothetical protein